MSPNPAGINSFGGPFEHEQPYGAVEKLKNLSRLAPTAQPTALNEPRRAQRRAIRRERRAPQPAPLSPPPPQITPQESLRSFWQALAADPEASDLVRQLAQEA